MLSKIFERSDSLAQVAVEVGHTGRKEGVNHRARQEASEVCLEETYDEGFVGLPGKNRRNELEPARSLDWFWLGEIPTHPEIGEQMQPQGWLNPLT